MFAAAIFDMDGLLIDSERCLCDAWIEASRECARPLTEDDYLYTVGRNVPESRAHMAALLGADYAAVHQRVACLVGPESDHVFPLKPGAVELLGALAELRVPCAVASSTRHGEIRRRLAAVGVLQHFRAVAGGDEVARGKPDPAVYALAAARLGMEPRKCLAFEDSENGAIAALGAGMQVVVVPDLKTPRVAGVLAVLPSLAEVGPRLFEWFGASYRAQ